jgi:outer membrane protein TolC
LRRRPDIRKAESQIHSATARIGVATADLFPKFNLVGSAGYQGTALTRTVASRFGFWSIGPSIDWQIFSAGAVRANIEVQKALTEQTSLNYQNTVLRALQDVENALIAYAKEQERQAALIKTVEANKRAVDISTQLYKQGQTEFLNVLSAQRLLYGSEDALALSTKDLSIDLVSLYKALGGGWDDADPNSSPILDSTER